jgi:hypothetical protein
MGKIKKREKSFLVFKIFSEDSIVKVVRQRILTMNFPGSVPGNYFEVTVNEVAL